MYDIKDDLWNQCSICGDTRSVVNSEFGGCGRYSTQNFKEHLLKKHNMSLEEYFEKVTNRPKCHCGGCDKLVNIKRSGRVFSWRKYACGNNDGVKLWSKNAKTGRLGINNPMYGLRPWNEGETKETSESVRKVSEKLTGKKLSKTHKDKLSISAKKRIVHGHTGCKHSEESKEKIRAVTIKRIHDGDFKQTRTKPHIEMSNILTGMGIAYIEEYSLSVWSFDFYIKEYDLYIEVDGDYFHSNPKIYPNGPKTKTQKINWYRDIKKNEFCINNNMKLIRFWESDILNNKEDIECRLKKLLALDWLEENRPTT